MPWFQMADAVAPGGVPIKQELAAIRSPAPGVTGNVLIVRISEKGFDFFESGFAGIENAEPEHLAVNRMWHQLVQGGEIVTAVGGFGVSRIGRR